MDKNVLTQRKPAHARFAETVESEEHEHRTRDQALDSEAQGGADQIDFQRSDHDSRGGQAI